MIDIDSIQRTVATAPDERLEWAVGATGEAANDAGSGPFLGTDGSEAVEAGVAADSGPPPEWLLAAVAAAEAAGHQTGPADAADTTDADEGGGSDAGPGPTA